MSNLAVASVGNLSAPMFDRHTAIAVAVEKRNTLIEFVRAVMQDGIDFGKIPGTDKPTLLKPGAEKLCTLFSYLPAYEIVEKSEDWTGKDHNGEAFFFYHYRCSIADQSGRVIATGEGSVNSWEKKYRYRDAKPVCPHCGQMAVNRSKDGGFYCWKKIGGCGATFAENDTQITSQAVGKIPNPDIFDQVNTMMKMAQKRALVAACLLACNASEFFTQDVEDMNVLDAQIVTTAPARPGEPLVPIARLQDVQTRTGFTMQQISEIAGKQKPRVNPDGMSLSDFMRLRNAVYASWGHGQGAFKAPTHAWNAFQALLKDLEPEASDGEIWDAWSAEVHARLQPTTEVVEEEF